MEQNPITLAMQSYGLTPPPYLTGGQQQAPQSGMPFTAPPSQAPRATMSMGANPTGGGMPNPQQAPLDMLAQAKTGHASMIIQGLLKHLHNTSKTY